MCQWRANSLFKSWRFSSSLIKEFNHGWTEFAWIYQKINPSTAFQYPTPAALRWLIFTNKDGFDVCIVRRGRRILIDEEAYFQWLDLHSKRTKGLAN